MKKIISKISFLLLLCLTLTVLCGCKKEDNKIISDDAFFTRYEDGNGSDIVIRRNNDEEDTLSLVLSFFRLAYFEASNAKQTKSGIEFTCFDPNGNGCEGLIYKVDDEVVIKFTNIDWSYIKTGDEFDGYKFVEKKVTINPQTKDNFIEEDYAYIIKDNSTKIGYRLDARTLLDENLPCLKTMQSPMGWVRNYLDNSMDNEKATDSGFGMGDMISLTCDNENNILRVDQIAWWD